ncbi:MAG: glycoside hydrolase family 2 TIM barrel-domain containing protein [Eisenbergiella massiliensis]
MCDELGFYVYEECFDKWTGGLYGRYFETEWKKDVEAMVKRDRNRACIFIWGVGNEVENQGQPSMLAILKMLKDYVLTMDATRPVTYAMNPHFKRESNVDLSQIKDIQKFVDEADDTEIYDVRERVERICRIGEIVDVISCNYQEQWYPMIHEAMPDKLILGTEIYQFFKDIRSRCRILPMKILPWCLCRGLCNRRDDLDGD